MFAVIVNTITILIGCSIGLLLRKGLPESISDAMMKGLGLCTIIIGIQGMIEEEYILVLIISTIAGIVIGELLDIDGRVIGVNDFILSPQGGNIGLGFAIAGNLAHGICRDLIQSGRANRSWVGILLSSVPEPFRQRNRLPQGVLIARMFRNSPAHKAGLKPGDLILKIDGQPADEVNKARLLIFSRRPGDELLFRIHRSGREQEIKVKAAAMPDYSMDDDE